MREFQNRVRSIILPIKREALIIFIPIKLKHPIGETTISLNTYWTKPRPTSKIITLSSAMVGDAAGVAHHWRRKHNNFDVGRGWVQISVLVSPCIRLSINCCTFTLLMYKIEKKWFIVQTATPLSDLAQLQHIRS